LSGGTDPGDGGARVGSGGAVILAGHEGAAVEARGNSPSAVELKGARKRDSEKDATAFVLDRIPVVRAESGARTLLLTRRSKTKMTNSNVSKEHIDELTNRWAELTAGEEEERPHAHSTFRRRPLSSCSLLPQQFSHSINRSRRAESEG